MQQDESDELPELNFGKKMLLWWAYSDIQAEHNFDRLAAGEGEDPRRVKKEVFGLLGKLGKWERVYLICLFDSLAERDELHEQGYTDAEMAVALDIVRKKIERAKVKMMRERRKAQAQATAETQAPTPTPPSTPPAPTPAPTPSTAEATPPAEIPPPTRAKRRRKRE